MTRLEVIFELEKCGVEMLLTFRFGFEFRFGFGCGDCVLGLRRDFP